MRVTVTDKQLNETLGRILGSPGKLPLRQPRVLNQPRVLGPALETDANAASESSAPAVALRPEQKKIIRAILNGRDVLAVLPTGSGKSACYQIPALLLPGITLVITPLVALMQDQVQKLNRQGIPTGCISGSFLHDGERGYFLGNRGVDTKAGPQADGSFGAQAGALNDVAAASGEAQAGGPNDTAAASGETQADAPEQDSHRKIRNRIFLKASRGELKIIYITPERLRTGAFLRFAQNVPISFMAVDEAHCISLWGYEFRQRYLEISKFLSRLDEKPVVAAFTATATKTVREDIQRFLGLRKPKEVLVQPQRPNLSFEVQKPKSEQKKNHEILSFLKHHTEDCGMIYCAAVYQVNELYQYLQKAGVSVSRYYAELDAAEDLAPGESKKGNLSSFLKGKTQVMVSTTALGMGIDKRDIRFVIHYTLPLCLENYTQEAGRAGRDGNPSECILYYMPQDIEICHGLIDRSLAEGNLSPEGEALRRRISLERLQKMLEYVNLPEGTKSHQAYITSYFESFEPEVMEEDRLVLQEFDHIRRDMDVLYINTTKVAQEIRKGRRQGREIVVSGRGKQTLTVDFSLSQGLSYFDMMVADAVYTLMKFRAGKITPRNVLVLLSGDSKISVREERKQLVNSSIRRMMETWIEIDRSNSLGYGFLYDNQRRRVLKGAFLPITESRGGFVYDPKVLPPLYEYGEIMNGQFFTASKEELQSKTLPASMENLMLRHYLRTRIGSMSGMRFGGGSSVTSRVLRMDTLVQVLSIAMPEGAYYRRRKLHEIWDKCELILTEFVKVGLIQDFAGDQEAGRFEIQNRSDWKSR